MLGLALPGKNLHRWILGYARALLERAAEAEPVGPRHVLVALCDHFEPLWGGASDATGSQRVERWLRGYPELARAFRDSDGRPPRHSFFFPLEQYRPEYLEMLASLTRDGLAEVELHLHHDADTAENLEHTLQKGVQSFSRHGLLGRDRADRIRYGFIHGNWCLANSRRDGRWCGVDNELELLFATGCYADFTFPSAPDETQPGIVDRIYWPAGDPSRARAHEHGERARVGSARDDRVLCIQGPLALCPGGRFGLRIENGALSARDPATPRRAKSWLAQAIHVEGRSDWIFVKLHTHGAPEPQADSLLGDGGRALHQALGALCTDGSRFLLHYVTAREMFNVALAAMHGRSGDPAGYLSYEISAPPVMS
ncbi:MAG: hypothetical protein HS104_00425 [Polyangiaceae bacterium]|nr:hypothetical protein [Polyangiaceae bacterium]MCE7890536.1 hypothetical protein [Sorangiineae bacterium PRO1]MCL4752790.1 hypothetical protein [Myxococcales bacterium]